MKKAALPGNLQTVEKVSFQQDIALNQLPKAHKSAAAPVAAMLQYLAENGVKSAKNFIAAPPRWAMAKQGTAIKSK